MNVNAPAKINLSLRVVGVRPDGYHELRTIFQSIALHDTVTIRVRRGPFVFRCDDPACPADASNLAWRAVEGAWKASRRKGTLRGLEVSLRKRIPMQAGLGGGSSDAAATLRALGSLWRIDESRLHAVAMSLGADVPYFLEGGMVLGLDRGDSLFPLAESRPVWVTLVLPDFGVSTSAAFGWWDAANDASSRAVPSRGLAGELGNDLQAPVALRYPQISQIVTALERAGAFYSSMSGSGSAVFGLFASRRSAEEAARAFGRRKRPVRALVTKTVNRTDYQRLVGVVRHRINLPFAPRSLGHS